MKDMVLLMSVPLKRLTQSKVQSQNPSRRFAFQSAEHLSEGICAAPGNRKRCRQMKRDMSLADFDSVSNSVDFL